MPTLFERIVAGELPATIVHQDERVTAFRDIHPRAPTHILIVPNKAIRTANDIEDSDEALVGHLFTVARDLARREGAMVMVHAENSDCIAWLTERLAAEGKTAPGYHARSRPMPVVGECTCST